MLLGPGVNIKRWPLCGRNWGTSHKHDAKLVPPLLKSLLRAAFEGAPDNPVDDFGEMTVVGQAEAVGPKDEELSDRGYALELRRENISSAAPRDERIARAHDLLQHSRRLHRGDDDSVLLARGPACPSPVGL